MPKNEENLRASEDFIRNVLERHFKQKVKGETLRSAAEKLCDALPARQKEAA